MLANVLYWTISGPRPMHPSPFKSGVMLTIMELNSNIVEVFKIIGNQCSA
jgi:hypothetical protein